MSHFDEKEIEKLARLCRIECTDEEKKKLLQKMKTVLAYVDQLKNIDTEGVAPCYTVLENPGNVQRADEVKDLLPRELFLANAPSHVGGMVRVPPVIKFNNQ